MPTALRKTVTAIGLIGIVALTAAFSTDLHFTVVLTNDTSSKLHMGVQNVSFKFVEAGQSMTAYPKFSDSPFSSTTGTYRADFEINGPGNRLCTIYFTESAEHTFFGGTKATACTARVDFQAQGYRCQAYATAPSEAGCLFTGKLR